MPGLKNKKRRRRHTGPIKKIEYWIGRTFVVLLHNIPLPVAYYLGRFVGWCTWLLPTKWRKIVIGNLATIDDYLAEKHSSQISNNR